MVNFSNSKFKLYMDEILAWNEKINLTAITDPDEFMKKHFEDSLAICGPAIENAKTVIDVGTGAGFPGIPLAITYPDKQFVLMDSLAKRLKVIEEICLKLDINNVSLVHARAEDLGHKEEYREKFDLCVSRAVANLATLSEYCIPFVKVGGYFAPYKGPGVDQEMAESKKALSVLGCQLENISYMDDDDLSHSIVYFKKLKPTPSKYPRKAGMPSKSPIR